MFKFFRKYNKLILAVGGSLLMVIFLLPSGASQFQPDAGEQSIGSINANGQSVELTVNDRRTASSDLAILNALGQLNMRLPVPVGGSEDEATRWLLMLHEAEAQGLYGSDAQTNSILQYLEVGPARLAEVKTQFKIPDSAIYQAMRHWQMVEQLERLTLNLRRISEPQMRHFANDLQSKVTVQTVALRAADMVDATEQPIEEQLQRQYERYMMQLPGRSAPYGFGYRLPARVKLEYMAFPLDRIKETVSISEVDAARYYQQNKQQFVPEAEGEGEEATPASTEPKPFAEVMPQIIDQLKTAQARQKQQEMAKWAAALVAQSERALPRDGGFRVVPADYKPVDLESVAQQTQQEFGVLADVVRLEDHWYDMTQLDALSGIGQAKLRIGSGDNARLVPAAAYIATTRELRQGQNPLNLQAKILGQPLFDESGSVYLFRITEAHPSRLPLGLDEVREQVLRDVKMLQVYNRMKDNAQRYIDLAAADGMEELAKTTGEDGTVIEVPAFSRRQFDRSRGGDLVVPVLPEVGRSASFVDASFALAQQVEEAGGLASAPANKQIAAIPMDAQMTVYVTKLTAYEPITTAQYETFKAVASYIIPALDQEQLAANPFSLEALKQRMQFAEPQIDTPEEEDPAEAPAP
jgi:hypothetical protein